MAPVMETLPTRRAWTEALPVSSEIAVTSTIWAVVAAWRAAGVAAVVYATGTRPLAPVVTNVGEAALK